MSSNYYSSRESELYRVWLIETLTNSLGVPAEGIDPDRLQMLLEKAIYKGTNCGAWAKIIEKDGTIHLVVGTIVEGSNAEYTEEVNLEDCNQGKEKELCQRFWAAIDNCEKFAEEHFDYDDEIDGTL